MRKIEPELITGMGYIGDNPGVLYRMGGAGEQTVVTGNPALLEGVKGSRITSLTLHGKSTQGSTTGAQLFDVSQLEDGTNNGVIGNKTKDYGYHLKGTTAEGKYFTSNGVAMKLDPGNYHISSGNKANIAARIYASITRNGKKKFYFNANFEVIDGDSVTIYAQVEPNSTVDVTLYPMLVAGTEPLPYEPYTGGAPSPSPSYPQDIENAGQSGEIGIEVGNNGYIQKGTYFLDVRPFSLKKGYTYHIKCEKIITTTINCFVMNEYNKNFKNSAELYDYGYTTKKLTIPNSTGIVDKECMMPKRYDGDGYTFTVKAEGLYLYQAVNAPDKNTDELYIGYAPNILNEEYKKQTLIIPTPGGLLGIPVSSGGNYTDEKGQQWVADEIDLAMGERVQWIGKYELTGKENVADFGLNPRTRMVSINIPDAYIDAGNHGYLKAVMSNKYKQAKCTELANNINLIARGQQRNICFSIPTDVGIEDFKTDLSNQYASGRPVKVYYKLATPIRTPLPSETIAAYKSLKTYSPTTTVINDAGAGMIVGYRRK